MAKEDLSKYHSKVAKETMDSDILDIQILNFINPHIFFVTTDLDKKHRALQIQNISDRIRRSKVVQLSNHIPLNDQVIAVHHEGLFCRATVIEIFGDSGVNKCFSCWLVDQAITIKTNKIYEIPKELQHITPKCKQASLNNICYLHEKLELGVTGTKKLIPGVIPSAGIIQFCLGLISNSDKLQIKVAERFNNILIGEIIIYNAGKIIFLTQELLNRELVSINEVMFSGLKYGTNEFLKSHISSIYQVDKKSPAKNVHENLNERTSISKMIDSLKGEIEDMDISELPPLENGRRRKNKVETSPLVPESDKEETKVEKESTSPAGKYSRLKMAVKKKQEEQQAKAEQQTDVNIEGDNTPKKALDPLKKAIEYRKGKLRISESSEEQTIYTSGHTSSLIASGEESEKENKENKAVSPFASITSERKSRPVGLFLPAGMERSMSQGTKTQKPKVKRKKEINSDIEKPEPQEDCLTIQVPKVSDTDQESEVKPEESSESETAKREIFTKQDFCKLVQGCTCIKCRITLEEDDWDSPIQFEDEHEEDKLKPKVDGVIIKAPKLLKSSENAVFGQSEILSINYGEMTSMDKNLSCKVLVHGESIPNPIKRVAQVNLHKDIHLNVSKINYKESKRIQHYAFPAITRNQHVFMVNEQKSGKTMAYLPIVLSFVIEKDERYSQLLKMGGGPIVVILCSNSKKCEEVYDLANVILNRLNKKCHLVTYPRYGNMSNVDILITMPTVLQTLISSRVTNFKRLCHLILEDADVTLKNHGELILKFINYSDLVLEHRKCPKSIQLITCSQRWTSQLEDILLKLDKIPTVCIGNHLEAAFYGKIKFSFKFMESCGKEEYLQSILSDKFKFTKSVVICNQDDVGRVQDSFMLNGIEYTSLLNVTQQEDILYYESTWNNTPPGNYSVLVCTDEMYNTMNITSAHLLVHFSLPYSWAQFIRRFSCLLENVQSPLIGLEKRKIEISSHVLVDESCGERMSRFSNFFKIADLEKGLPEKMKAYFKQIKIEAEQNHIKRKIDLCHTLKVFGECSTVGCKKRHFLDNDLDHSDLLPKNGSIQFKILKMLDAGSCSIKILESFDVNGNSTKKFNDINDVIAGILSKKADYRSVSKPIIAHLYLIKDKGEFYRCKLVENDEFPILFCIDKGIYLKGSLDQLFKMPEELKKIPPQCFEIHFANLIPPFEDSRFSRFAGIKAQFLKDSNCPDSVMVGTIVLQLGNVLWLDDVYEIREMYDKNLPNMGFQLSKELVKEGLAIKSSKPMANLYNLCKEFNINLPEYKLLKPQARKISDEVQILPNWAFLDPEELHEVTFTFAENPQEFYVRQNKFSKQLEDLEKLIQTEIKKPFYPALKKVKVWQCCLYQDEVTKDYSRGLVLEVINDEAKIMFVDYGDCCLAPISDLKYITNELIMKLPFQAIRCTLTGVKCIEADWCDDAVNLMYRMAYEDELNTRLRLLYVKVDSKQDNPQIKRQYCYSVTLKDGLERRIVVNKLLIDCGYALQNGDPINDFDLPEIEVPVHDNFMEEGEETSFFEEIERDNEEFPGNLDDILSFEIDGFDCVIFDPSQFLVDCKAARRTDENNATSRPQASDQLSVLKAAPVVGYLTPVVVWSQTDNYLKINIEVSDVTDPKMVVKKSRFFQFSAFKGDKQYALKLLLYAHVESTLQHTILGSQIRVTLKKCEKAEWPRLLKTTEKMRKITYDIGAIKIEDEKPKKFLELGISDDDSSDENDGGYYLDFSDLDSEYDFDIPNDE